MPTTTTFQDHPLVAGLIDPLHGPRNECHTPTVRTQLSDVSNLALDSDWNMLELAAHLNAAIPRNTTDNIKICAACEKLTLFWNDETTWTLPAIGPRGGIKYVCRHCHEHDPHTYETWRNSRWMRYLLVHRRFNKGAPLIRNYSYNVLDTLNPLSLYGEHEPFFLGVELELSLKNTLTPANVAPSFQSTYRLLKVSPHTIFKSDSSISGIGIEIVSTPASLGAHRQLWIEFFAHPELTKWQAHSSCGMHVHVDRNNISILTLGKMNTFFNDPVNIQFLTKLAGRDAGRSSGWARTQGEVKVKDVLDGRDTERYSALNLTPTRTAEIRIFASTTNPLTFMTRLEFAHAICYFCANTSMLNLNHHTLAQYVAKHDYEYPALWQWFQETFVDPFDPHMHFSS